MAGVGAALSWAKCVARNYVAGQVHGPLWSSFHVALVGQKEHSAIHNTIYSKRPKGRIGSKSVNVFKINLAFSNYIEYQNIN
jgi:hypothetical protein